MLTERHCVHTCWGASSHCQPLQHPHLPLKRIEFLSISYEPLGVVASQRALIPCLCRQDWDPKAHSREVVELISGHRCSRVRNGHVPASECADQVKRCLRFQGAEIIRIDSGIHEYLSVLHRRVIHSLIGQLILQKSLACTRTHVVVGRRRVASRHQSAQLGKEGAI